MATNKFLNQAYEIVASNLGVVYLAMGLLTLLFLLILAMSRYGNIKLGKEDEKPEYGNFGWASMLFCCGIGASLVLYGTTEWVDYYLKPPFGAEPKSIEAIAWASTYGMFHWGIIGWAIYCFPGVAIGYSYYVRNSGSLKTSTGCEAILGNQRNGNLARVIDLIYMIALVGVLGAGLGLTSPVVSATITEFFSIEQNLTITVSCLLVCMLIYSISLYFGVEEGKNTRFEFGASAGGYYKFHLMKNISMENILNLYSNYLEDPQNIDVDYTMNLVMNINKYISTTLAYQTIYDDNAFQGLQTRQVFGLGINYNF